MGVRCLGCHIFWTIGSKMEGRLPAALYPQEDCSYSRLLEADSFNWKIQRFDHHLLACRVMPQPPSLPCGLRCHVTYVYHRVKRLKVNCRVTASNPLGKISQSWISTASLTLKKLHFLSRATDSYWTSHFQLPSCTFRYHHLERPEGKKLHYNGTFKDFGEALCIVFIWPRPATGGDDFCELTTCTSSSIKTWNFSTSRATVSV
jgi:hypothetical protein